MRYPFAKKSGIEILKEVKGVPPDAGVIMMTAFGTVEDAVEAMKAGHTITSQSPSP